jgi:hypothetical protein
MPLEEPVPEEENVVVAGAAELVTAGVEYTAATGLETGVSTTGVSTGVCTTATGVEELELELELSTTGATETTEVVGGTYVEVGIGAT